jgi:hypothetical protein
MLKGIAINETVDFVSAQDKDEPKTVFVLGNISHEQKMKLFLGSITLTEGNVDLGNFSGDKIFDILLAGVRSIKNLDGVDIPVVTKEALEKIPFLVLVEVLGKVVEINQVGEVERKN